jgi:hypothetical protein
MGVCHQMKGTIEMLAAFRFRFSDLSCSYDDEGIVWGGRCVADFENTNPDSYPLRGDVDFLNEYRAEIRIYKLVDGQLDQIFMDNGLDERVAARLREGYPMKGDAYHLRHIPGTLGISIALKPEKHAHLHSFLSTHFGRPDLEGYLSALFYGFNEPPFAEYPDLPTAEEFRAGRSYFAISDVGISLGVPRNPSTPPARR